MREINGQTLGPIEVTEDSVLYGQITDGVTVSENTTFQVCGQITGDLTALHGANVIISGMVNGTIKNLGGKVSISGIVDDYVNIHKDAETTELPNCVIRTRQK